jgi:hypothetical protein
MTRAKFRCYNITPAGTQTIDGKEVQGKNYGFSAVMVEKDAEGNVTGNTENAIFGMYTPAGSLNMTVYNDAVQFEINKEYYLDFTPAN